MTCSDGKHITYIRGIITHLQIVACYGDILGGTKIGQFCAKNLLEAVWFLFRGHSAKKTAHGLAFARLTLSGFARFCFSLLGMRFYFRPISK